MPKKKRHTQKKKKQKRTVLFFGEGADENAFLKYIRRLYAHNASVKITIRDGNGGSADMVVKKASNFTGDFDHRIAMIDNDKPQKEMTAARKMAKESNIDLIECEPCLEGLLLTIIEQRSVSSKTSKQCKREFEKKHICENKRCDVDEYARVFPKDVLDDARKRIPELDRIIRFMEGKK